MIDRQLIIKEAPRVGLYELAPPWFFSCGGLDDKVDGLPEHHALGLRVLAAIAGSLRPRRILEIGVRLGYSLGVLARASAAGVVDGWDAELYIPESNAKARDNLKSIGVTAGLKSLDSQKVSKIADDYDLIHVDADHRYGPALHDILLACSASPVVVVDDYHPRNHPGVFYAVKQAAALTGFRLATFEGADFGGHSCKGHAVLWREL